MPFTILKTTFHSSFFTFHFWKIYVSRSKTRSFGVRKTVFREVKPICLGGERCMFRKPKVAHLPLTFLPLPLFTGLANCTRRVEEFTATSFLFENSSIMVLKSHCGLLTNVKLRKSAENGFISEKHKYIWLFSRFFYFGSAEVTFIRECKRKTGFCFAFCSFNRNFAPDYL